MERLWHSGQSAFPNQLNFGKKVVAPSARRQMAQSACKEYRLSIKRSCDLHSISASHWRYTRQRDPEDKLISDALMALSQVHIRWGFGLMYLHLRNVQGRVWNHKRVYRIERDAPLPPAPPSAPNVVWSMDFMHDQLSDARSYRSLNILDDFNRELLCAEIDLSLPSARVIRCLDQLIEWRGLPQAIRCDNGLVYISELVDQWAVKRGVVLWFIQPGNPQQNAYVERFNKTMREELLSANLFDSIEQAQDAATKWQWIYNNNRPSIVFNGLTPIQWLNKFKAKTKLQPSSTLD
jgi:putative transposase